MFEKNGLVVSPKYCSVCLRGLSKEATRCYHCGSKKVVLQELTFGDPILPSAQLCRERLPKLT